MLKISEQTANSFHEHGIAALCQRILAHWHKDLGESAGTAGKDGRDAVLEDIARLAREDPDLTESALMMLADLRIVEVANQVRARGG